jgi:hypothetical protein
MKPPIAVEIIAEKEKALAPQRRGTKPPIDEPTIIPIHTKDFEFMSLVYNSELGLVKFSLCIIVRGITKNH